MSHFLVFGTHPRLSLAEYRAVRPSLSNAPRLMAKGAVVDDPEWDGAGLMRRLGGTVKLGDVLISEKLADIDADRIADLCKDHPRGKNISFGFSVIGGSPGAHRALERLPLHVKRAFAARGVKSRWVTSKDSPSLSPAAVAKLKLTTEGYDFVLLVEGDHAHIGLTTHVQDADAWSLRDYGRPARDDEAGMLPPKLARMMVNLAKIDSGSTLLDPFCGSGTVLMEAALATDALRIIGSDVDAKQVADTNKNTEWLIEKGVLKPADKKRVTAFVNDVKSLGSKLDPASVDRVVTEGDLGPPLRGSEPQKVLDKNRDAISELWRASLTALSPLLKPGARLVIIWPSFKTANALSRVKLDDECAALGYRFTNPLMGWDDTDAPLIYHREGQKVARRIVVLEKKT